MDGRTRLNAKSPVAATTGLSKCQLSNANWLPQLERRLQGRICSSQGLKPLDPFSVYIDATDRKTFQKFRKTVSSTRRAGGSSNYPRLGFDGLRIV
jgi:hypothetical protein